MAAAAIGATSVSAAELKGASIRPISMEPLQVRGQGFKPGESVRIWVTRGDRRELRQVVAARVGSFTVTFSAGAYTDPCNSDLAILARGARGSVASYKLPMRQCPPSLGIPGP